MSTSHMSPLSVLGAVLEVANRVSSRRSESRCVLDMLQLMVLNLGEAGESQAEAPPTLRKVWRLSSLHHVLCSVDPLLLQCPCSLRQTWP